MSLQMRYMAVLLITVGTTAGTRAEAGVIYNAASDFSPTNNPNGVWSYGISSTLGGPMTLYTFTAHSTGVDLWNDSGLFAAPWVGHNGTAGVATPGTFQFQPGDLGFHPGPNNEITIIRFTTPTAGSYDLSSSFNGLDFIGPTTTDVHVLLNGSSIFDGTVNGFGPRSGPSYNTTLVLAAGDTVDFAVDFGSNGNYLFDSTGISATLSTQAVPEPTSLTALGIGLVGLLCYGIRLRGHRGRAVSVKHLCV